VVVLVTIFRLICMHHHWYLFSFNLFIAFCVNLG